MSYITDLLDSMAFGLNQECTEENPCALCQALMATITEPAVRPIDMDDEPSFVEFKPRRDEDSALAEQATNYVNAVYRALDGEPVSPPLSGLDLDDDYPTVFPMDGVTESRNEWLEIHSTNPAHADGMPDRLRGRFETMSDLLLAVYLEGMDFANDFSDMTAESVEDYASHIAHQLTVQVCESARATKRTTVL